MISGKYCLLKKFNCPPYFKEGLIYWDDAAPFLGTQAQSGMAHVGQMLNLLYIKKALIIIIIIIIIIIFKKAFKKIVSKAASSLQTRK